MFGRPLPLFEPISSLHLQGFDREVFPRWQAVTNGGRSFVLLDNAGVPGPLLAVRPIDSNIADIREIASHPPIPRREFEITGKMSGTTFVQVFAPNGTTVLQQLQVVVKNPSSLKIAFHRVTDGLIETTARPQATGHNLQQELNAIFSQAKMQFDIHVPSALSTLSLRTTLHELVMEQRERMRTKRGWDELIAAGDADSHINVFFMKWHLTPGRLPSPIVEKDTPGAEGNVIFEDGMPVDKVLTALAHRIGLFLGCSVTSSDRQTHHLMHASRAAGDSPGPAGIHFISRDCNNMMNHSGVSGPGT